MLLIASVIVWLLPFHVMGRQSGVPVRDYIAQSTEFLICIFALLAFAFESQRSGRWRHAVAAALLALLFLANILMISTGRTALAVIPLLLLILGFRLFGWKGVVLACVVGVHGHGAGMDGVAVPARAHQSQLDRSAALSDDERSRPRPASASSCGKRRPASSPRRR